MGTYLVVANQTLGGEDLFATIRERADEASRFHVVVPDTPASQLSSTWTSSGGAYAAAQPLEAAADRPQSQADARQLAHRRLERLLEHIRETGADADGTVGSEDPMEAIADALADDGYDEIILSTLPAGLSRWLKADLPSRIERRFDLPLTVITVER